MGVQDLGETVLGVIVQNRKWYLRKGVTGIKNLLKVHKDFMYFREKWCEESCLLTNLKRFFNKLLPCSC